MQQANERAAKAEASLAQTQVKLAANRTELDETKSLLGASNSDVKRLEASIELLQSESEQLQDDLDAILLQYDPQIRAALSQLQTVLVQDACTMGRKDAKDGTGSRDPLSDLNVDVPGGLHCRTLEELVDIEVMTAEYTRCFKEERSVLQEKRQTEQLTKDKGDGFYTVGEQMAAGTWRSTGGGSSCYWERLSGLSGDFGDIITNYPGSAGVTATISSSDRAFKSDGCGLWEYVG